MREVEHQNKKRGKLRTTMSQDRLISLAIMSMESDITKQLHYSDFIDELANAKSRKLNRL